MRMPVTVVSEGGEPHDVVVTADDTAAAGDVAEALSTEPVRSGAPRDMPANVSVLPVTAPPPLPVHGTGGPSLWADGVLCDPAVPVAQAPRPHPACRRSFAGQRTGF
ncbi:hypothetical protein ACVW19_003876 [Streptomyces sp. TE5632]